MSTSLEYLISELYDEHNRLMGVIPFCQTRAEALDIQNDILQLEDRIKELEN